MHIEQGCACISSNSLLLASSLPLSLWLSAQVLDHYTMQAKTNNPAVREAACTCLAEAASKIDAAIVEPHLQRIMSTLLACFRDDAWPVSVNNLAVQLPVACWLLPHWALIYLASLGNQPCRSNSFIMWGDCIWLQCCSQSMFHVRQEVP